VGWKELLVAETGAGTEVTPGGMETTSVNETATVGFETTTVDGKNRSGV